MKDPIEYLAQRYLLTTAEVVDLLHHVADVCRARRLDPEREARDKARHFSAENVVRDIADDR